jgi:peroxiredoxin
MRNLAGQPAAPFILADAEEKTYRLHDYRGSWLLMVFHRHLG